MNSLKSLCRCAKRAPVAFDQLEEQVEPLLGGQIGIELIVGLVGSIKARENLDDAIHTLILPGSGWLTKDAPIALSRPAYARSIGGGLKIGAVLARISTQNAERREEKGER